MPDTYITALVEKAPKLRRLFEANEASIGTTILNIARVNQFGADHRNQQPDQRNINIVIEEFKTLAEKMQRAIDEAVEKGRIHADADKLIQEEFYPALSRMGITDALDQHINPVERINLVARERNSRKRAELEKNLNDKQAEVADAQAKVAETITNKTTADNAVTAKQTEFDAIKTTKDDLELNIPGTFTVNLTTAQNDFAQAEQAVNTAAQANTSATEIQTILTDLATQRNNASTELTEKITSQAAIADELSTSTNELLNQLNNDDIDDAQKSALKEGLCEKIENLNKAIDELIKDADGKAKLYAEQALKSNLDYLTDDKINKDQAILSPVKQGIADQKQVIIDALAALTTQKATLSTIQAELASLDINDPAKEDETATLIDKLQAEIQQINDSVEETQTAQNSIEAAHNTAVTEANQKQAATQTALDNATAAKTAAQTALDSATAAKADAEARLQEQTALLQSRGQELAELRAAAADANTAKTEAEQKLRQKTAEENAAQQALSIEVGRNPDVLDAAQKATLDSARRTAYAPIFNEQLLNDIKIELRSINSNKKQATYALNLSLHLDTIRPSDRDFENKVEAARKLKEEISKDSFDLNNLTADFKTHAHTLGLLSNPPTDTELNHLKIKLQKTRGDHIAERVVKLATLNQELNDKTKSWAEKTKKKAQLQAEIDAHNNPGLLGRLRTQLTPQQLSQKTDEVAQLTTEISQLDSRNKELKDNTGLSPTGEIPRLTAEIRSFGVISLGESDYNHVKKMTRQDEKRESNKDKERSRYAKAAKYFSDLVESAQSNKSSAEELEKNRYIAEQKLTELQQKYEGYLVNLAQEANNINDHSEHYANEADKAATLTSISARTRIVKLELAKVNKALSDLEQIPRYGYKPTRVAFSSNIRNAEAGKAYEVTPANSFDAQLTQAKNDLAQYIGNPVPLLSNTLLSSANSPMANGQLTTELTNRPIRIVRDEIKIQEEDPAGNLSTKRLPVGLIQYTQGNQFIQEVHMTEANQKSLAKAKSVSNFSMGRLFSSSKVNTQLPDEGQLRLIINEVENLKALYGDEPFVYYLNPNASDEMAKAVALEFKRNGLRYELDPHSKALPKLTKADVELYDKKYSEIRPGAVSVRASSPGRR